MTSFIDSKSARSSASDRRRSSSTVRLAVTRWRRADRETRRTLGPTLWAAVVTLVFFLSLVFTGLVGKESLQEAIYFLAVFPLASLRRRSYFSPVARIDNAFGDRHPVLTWPEEG